MTAGSSLQAHRWETGACGLSHISVFFCSEQHEKPPCPDISSFRQPRGCYTWKFATSNAWQKHAQGAEGASSTTLSAFRIISSRLGNALTWDTFRICRVKRSMPVVFLSSQFTLGALVPSVLFDSSAGAGSTVSSTACSRPCPPAGPRPAVGPLPAPHASPPAAASQAPLATADVWPSLASPGTTESTTACCPGSPLPSIASAISAVRYRTGSPLPPPPPPGERGCPPALCSVTAPAPGGRCQLRAAGRAPAIPAQPPATGRPRARHPAPRTHRGCRSRSPPASPAGRALPSQANASSSSSSSLRRRRRHILGPGRHRSAASPRTTAASAGSMD